MSDIGPSLPPHLLAKRKRQQEEETKNDDATASGAKRSPSPDGAEKRRKVMGPAMPPAPLEARPTEPADVAQEDSSDDEDDLGPALPTSGASASKADDEEKASTASAPHAEKLKRDDWMTMPPKQDDLAARMDPSRQRARGFNTGKGAKGPGNAASDNSWNETAEQKQKRLQNEMLGISSPGTGPENTVKPAKSAKQEAEDRKKRDEIERSRGPSLMEQHKIGTGQEAEDDDPSKRAFDREKDMGSGMRIGNVQRSEMLKKAGGFSSRFSGGNYL